MNRLLQLSSVLALAMFLNGCEREAPAQTFDVLLNGEGEEVSLPELAPPFATEEIEAMVETFAWSETDELPIDDEDGRPALHYALILLRDCANLEELNIFDIHNDALPLFGSEYDRWDGQTGVHRFPGSHYGDFAFALVPAEAYNLFRQSALDGEPIFDAIILRDVPDADAALPGGSIDYDWLGEQGFVYGGNRADEISSSSSPLEGDVGRVESPLLGRVFRSIRRVIRQVVNGVRQVLSEVRQFFGGSRGFSLRLYVHNTDTDFDTDPNELMRQAWLGERAGRPIWVKGLEVLVASGTMISLDRGETDENGLVRFDTPQARRIRVHIRMKNAAADIVGLLWDQRITVFHGSVDDTDPVHINADVRHGDMNVMAQMTSARDFVQQALDYESPRAVRSRLPAFSRSMPTALVRTGVIAEIGAAVSNNAFTPCLGFYGFGSFSFGGGRGWSVAANVASILDEADIWLPSSSQTSRVVPTHEYSHFIMCTFLADNSRRAFGRAYSEVWQDSISMDGPTDGQAGILAEAWADFLSSQIAGGVDYFQFGLRQKEELGAHGQAYCRADADPNTLPCLEDNIGGPPMSFPRGQQVRANWLRNPRNEDIARFATILTDAFDGDGAELHNGAVWEMTRDATNTVTDVGWRFGGHARDEDVVMPGVALHQIIDDWAFTSTRLNYASFLNAMARTMWLNGATPEEVCELFALHSPSGMCSDLIDTLLDTIAPSEPFPLEVEVFHDGVMVRPRATMVWSDLSSLASGFEASCDAEDGSHRSEQTLAYARRQNSEFRDLPYDRRLTLSVVTTTDTQRSDPASAEVWTPAEPIGDVDGIGLPGAVLLEWAPVEASSVRVRMTSPEARDVGTVLTSDGDELLIEGLAGDTDYTFELISINGAGALSQFPSAPLTVRTLAAPVLYVATFGNDAAPLAGTRAAPFATLGAAIAAASVEEPVTIRIERGVYGESSLTIDRRTVILEGGYEVLGDSWTRSPGETSEVRITASGRLPSVRTEHFNASARESRAGIYATSAVLVLDGLDVVVQTTEVSRCVAAVYSDESELSVVDTRIDSSGTGICRVGVEALGGRVSVRDSSLQASDGTRISAGSEHAALVTDSLADVVLTDSELVGVAAGGNVSARIGAAAGWFDLGSRSLRVSRSRLSALTGDPDVRAGFVAGADVSTTGLLFADNSIFNSPSGADAGHALRVAGAGSGANVQLVQCTASVGTHFAPSTGRSGVELSTVSLQGTIRSMTLINNLLAFADWGAFSRYAVVLDLDDLDGSRVVSSSVRGNIFSYPPADRFGSGLGGGPLVMCEYAGIEFNMSAVNEVEVNEALRYTCRTGGSLVAANNIALLSNPANDSAFARRGVVLDDTGDVVRSGTPFTGRGTADLLRGGVPLESPLPVSDVELDRNGTRRARTRPGVGAYVVP